MQSALTVRALQLDDWLTQHEEEEARKRLHLDADDGWTVVKRKGVSRDRARACTYQNVQSA